MGYACDFYFVIVARDYYDDVRKSVSFDCSLFGSGKVIHLDLALLADSHLVLG